VKQRVVLLLPLLSLVLSASIFMQPMSASAAVHQAHKGKHHFFWKKGHARLAAANNNLIYHNGPVEVDTTQVYAIFWEPTGSVVSSTYNELLTRYFGDVGSSTLYHNNIQYADNSNQAPQNATLANTWVDTAAYPSHHSPFSSPVVLDSDIQNEVSHAMTVNGWLPAINHAFFVFLAANEMLCIDSTFQQCSAPVGGFCAYHYFFTAPGSLTQTNYAAMPYDGNDLPGCYGLTTSPNNDPAADAEISTTSHEQMEAATDPLGNAWFDNSGQEIGDKCAYAYSSLNPDGSNVSWNKHAYIVQSEWDNAVAGCMLKGP